MKSIINSIYNEPEKWRVDEFNFTHEDGVKIWIANGFFFVRLRSGGSFNFIQKIMVYKAYRWWLKNAPLNALSRHKASA